MSEYDVIPDSTLIMDSIATIKDLLAGYEPGNAMLLVDLSESFNKLCAILHTSESKACAKLAKELEILVGILPSSEDSVVPLLAEITELVGAIGTELVGEAEAQKAVALIKKKRKALQNPSKEEAEHEGSEGMGAEADGERTTPKSAMVEEKTAEGLAEADPATKTETPAAKVEDMLHKQYDESYFASVIDDQNLHRQFFNEAVEHIEEAQSVLVEVEYDPTNQELLNTIFRNFHTIKGSSAFLGLRNVEELSHAMEDLLAIVREGKIVFSKELISVIFSGIEILRTILDSMLVNEFSVTEMVASFKLINIYPYIKLMHKIIAEYKYKKIGEILEEEGKISPDELGYLLKKQKETDKKFGEIAVEEKIVTNDDLIQAIKKQKEQAAKLKKIGFVKVSNEKLNTLIDIVGELVINQSMLKQELVGIRNNERVDRSMSQLEAITTTIKNLVLSMGMVPISEIFNKLRVVARNTANELGKSVFIEMHGEDTELDRNVIETIYDPLMHILRNAIDHGIEEPQERTRLGKDRVGKIVLQADHKGSGIEITIADDGKGIKRNVILKKAIAMKLVKEDEVESLSDKEVFNFMFLPGFSTADEVTTISGRGVGLDVVKKNIESIHGRVDISTEPGKGTKFIIKLPLSLAIIEGFVTRIGRNKYIFPFNAIEEINVISKENFIYTEGGSEVIIYYRSQHIPVIFARDVLKENAEDEEKTNYLTLLFSVEQSKYCVVVDEIIGKQEIVIKNLSGILEESTRYLSGGTIFGDGSIGFVVDMQGFIEAVD